LFTISAGIAAVMLLATGIRQTGQIASLKGESDFVSELSGRMKREIQGTVGKL